MAKQTPSQESLSMHVKRDGIEKDHFKWGESLKETAGYLGASGIDVIIMFAQMVEGRV